MVFLTWEQVLGLKLPAKGQTRRPNFPYELAVQLWKHGWSYPRNNRRTSGGRVYRPYTPWDEWQERHPITDQQIAEANLILNQNLITLPVLPGRGKNAVGRIRVRKIRRERLQDISEEDCKAEGARPSVGYALDYIPGWQSLSDDRYFTDEQRLSGYVGAFAQMWDSIYPKEHNWLENPSVWVLDFEMERSH